MKKPRLDVPPPRAYGDAEDLWPSLGSSAAVTDREGRAPPAPDSASLAFRDLSPVVSPATEIPAPPPPPPPSREEPPGGRPFGGENSQSSSGGRGSTRVDELSTDYVSGDTRLMHYEQDNYKAGGFLPVYLDTSQKRAYVLLGLEKRYKPTGNSIVLHLCGGKREKYGTYPGVGLRFLSVSPCHRDRVGSCLNTFVYPKCRPRPSSPLRRIPRRHCSEGI